MYQTFRRANFILTLFSVEFCSHLATFSHIAAFLHLRVPHSTLKSTCILDQSQNDISIHIFVLDDTFHKNLLTLAFNVL